MLLTPVNLYRMYEPLRVIDQNEQKLNPFDIPMGPLNPLSIGRRHKAQCFAQCWQQPFDNICYQNCMTPPSQREM